MDGVDQVPIVINEQPMSGGQNEVNIAMQGRDSPQLARESQVFAMPPPPQYEQQPECPEKAATSQAGQVDVTDSTPLQCHPQGGDYGSTSGVDHSALGSANAVDENSY